MNTVKTIDFSFELLDEASTMLKVICHPVRMQIVKILSTNNKLNVTQIQEHLELDQASTSRHLTLMKNKKVLSSFREGKNIFYTLKSEKINQIVDCILECNETLRN